MPQGTFRLVPLPSQGTGPMSTVADMPQQCEAQRKHQGRLGFASVFVAASLTLLLFFCWQLPPAWGFPGGSAGEESACKLGDLGSFSGLGRSPGEGKGYTLQYSALENSHVLVHGAAKSQTQLSE